MAGSLNRDAAIWKEGYLAGRLGIVKNPYVEKPVVIVDKPTLITEHEVSQLKDTSGRPSLCRRCLVKKEQVRLMGIPYCFDHCPCSKCSALNESVERLEKLEAARHDK